MRLTSRPERTIRRDIARITQHVMRDNSVHVCDVAVTEVPRVYRVEVEHVNGVEVYRVDLTYRGRINRIKGITA